jgi:GR25 family glycosyltransferase involved in LPS biosynthesis
MNKLLNLPHVLWINMNESIDRYNHMTNLFKQYPIKNTRIEAIHFSTIKNRYKTTKKAMAVHLSHLKALQYFLNNFDNDYIIIGNILLIII